MPLLLVVLTVLSLVSMRCDKPRTPQAPKAPETATTPDAGTQADVGPEAPASIPAVLLDEAKLAHEESAKYAIAGIKTLLEARDYGNALRLAANCVKDYAGTAVAVEFAPLLKQSQDAAAALERDRAAALAAPADERAARHGRFVAARDAGVAAMDKQDFAGAIGLFQQALQEEDDPQTRGMLQHASNFVGKPRIAIAEFAVVGDVGIPEAGKAVPELMLGRFDPQRFTVVERAWLDSILTQQGLSAAQVAEMPALLRVRRVDAVRYMVVGTVSRLGALTVSARLVDVWTGEAVQTAEVTANDPAGLQNSLTELTSILQMNNEEKANYLAFRQRQSDALTAVEVDPAAQAAAEQQRQAALEAQRQQVLQQQTAAFQQAQHEREAAVAVSDIKALFAAGDYANALRYIRWARQRFDDTSAAQELAGMETFAQARYQEQVAQQQNAAEWARQQAELAARHQRFVQYRDQGLAALQANDLLTALGLLQSALGEEDNPNVRVALDVVVRRMQRPGIAVLDFDVGGDIGMRRREAPRWLASLLLRRFAGDDSPYRVMERDEFLANLQSVGLTLADAQRDPFQPRMRMLRERVRFIIVGTATPGSIRLSTAMLDLAAGRTVQTAEFIAEDVRALPKALEGTAMVLQMTDDQKNAYIAQLDYANWMARGDLAAQGQQWDAALDAYSRACRVSNTPEALERMAVAGRNFEETRRARRAYDTTMAAAADSARAGRWDTALDLYRQAWGIIPTAEAKAGADDARAKWIATARDRRALYLTTMAGGDAFARNEDWGRALDAYQEAMEIEPTPEARAAVAGAKQAIADRQEARQRAYAGAMREARLAIEAGDWGKALDAFTRAAAIKDTREAAGGIATARKKIAELEANTRLYNAAMEQARAAVQANDWQKALAAHMRAAGIINTAEAQAAIELDKRRLAAIQQRDQKMLYDAAMADAGTHAGAGQWQEALDAYRSAYQVQKTREAAAGITQASKMLSDAAYNKKQYDKAMAEAAAAVQAGNWTKALAAYQQAAAIDATAQAKGGVESARQQIATTAAAEKKRQYTQYLNEGQAAFTAGDWKKALGSYSKAAAVDNTVEVQAAIAAAQKKISDANAAVAAAAEQKRQYGQLLIQGDAAGKANDWQRALDAYTKAAAIDNTAVVQANVANAKKKVADAAAATADAAGRKKQYDGLMADGTMAATAGDWAKALDAFTRAAAIDNTALAQAGVSNARKQLMAATAAAAAAEKKKQYDGLMAGGAAAVTAGDWQKALDAYTKASLVDNTAEVKAAIANARKKIADAATAATAAEARKKQYAQFMTEGDAAARGSLWQKALDAYTKAATIDNTAEAQAGITNARNKVAAATAAATAAAEKKRQYDGAMADGAAAAKAGDWQKALDAFTKAAAMQNAPEVQADIANVKKKIADAAAATAAAAAAAEKKKQYTQFMTEGDAAAKAGLWQKALDALTKAAAIDNTPEVQADIANARKKIADAASATAAAEKKKQYTQFMTEGDAAAKAGLWQKALDALTKAAAIDNTPEVQADIANAKKKLAATTPADKNKQYDKLISEGDAAAKSSDWQAALDAYRDAAGIDNTAAVKTKIANVKEKLFDKLVADGDRAGAAGNWKSALDLYTKAHAIKSTPELEAAIANARKKAAGGN
ncbi:MAG: hypothetical protein ACHRHE_14110 [Tepidisphaerales bacterium]